MLLYMCVRVCVCACVRACVCVCVRVCVHICVHISPVLGEQDELRLRHLIRHLPAPARTARSPGSRTKRVPRVPHAVQAGAQSAARTVHALARCKPRPGTTRTRAHGCASSRHAAPTRVSTRVLTSPTVGYWVERPREAFDPEHPYLFE